MGLFRWLSRFILIVLILNIVDNIICIIGPIMTNNMHFYPSLLDTLYILTSAPLYFSTAMAITSSFPMIRILILIFVLALLVAIVSARNLETMIFYEFIIFISISVLIIAEGLGYYSPEGTHSALPYSELPRFFFITKGGYIIKVLAYHLPFGFISLLIFIAISKYREFLAHLKFLKAPRIRSK